MNSDENELFEDEVFPDNTSENDTIDHINSLNRRESTLKSCFLKKIILKIL